MEPHQVLQQLLKARQSVCTIGRMSFTLRRPTEMELIRMRVGEERSIVVSLHTVQTHCTGWDGVLESDLLGANGSSDKVAFEPLLFQAWIEDRPDLWGPMAEHLKKQVDEYAKRLEALSGN